MQAFTAAPRDSFTAAQVEAALVDSSVVQVDKGLEIVDNNNVTLADISSDYQTGQVERDCTATVHGKCTLSISRALAWGSVRVRPYLLLTSEGITTRWNQGVYVLTTPDRTVGTTPETYTGVTGFDLLYLLDAPVGDSYFVAAGANVSTAIAAALSAAGIGGTLLLDGTATAATLASDMSWPLTSSEAHTWLDIINGLLAAIGYRGLWCDQDGNFRSEPNQDPAVRPVEYAFTADDQYRSLIGLTRTLTQDLWGAPNWWRFIQNGLTAAPVEGTGQYTVENLTDGLSSQASLGYVRRKPVQFLDAVDQASLVAQGDATVASDRQVVAVVKLTTGVWPGAGHYDVYTVADSELSGTPIKVLATGWVQPQDASDTQWTWQVVSW